MAAARKSSESSIILTAVFFFLFVVAVCTTVAFYQQAAKAKAAIATEQGAFGGSVGAVFHDNAWALTEENPPEMGIKFSGKSYAEVTDKLKSAAEYEKQVKPLLGWESLTGLQDALKDSPAQKDAAAKNQSAFSTMKGLLGYYEESNTQQAASITDLNAKVAALTKDKETLNATIAQQGKDLGQQIADLQKSRAEDVAKWKKDYDDLMASFDSQRQNLADTQGKLQQEINTHKTEVGKLQDQVASLKDEVRKLTVPGEGKQLTSEGKVVSIQSAYDMAYIDGGKDKGFKENDTFVVYGQTPGGSDRYKGTIKVTQVFDTTCRASIVDEKEFILTGDNFVSTKQWQIFHPTPPPTTPAVVPAVPVAPAAPAAPGTAKPVTPAMPAAPAAPGAATPVTPAAPVAPKPATPAAPGAVTPAAPAAPGAATPAAPAAPKPAAPTAE